MKRKLKINLLLQIVIAIGLGIGCGYVVPEWLGRLFRSEEHTSELQSQR